MTCYHARLPASSNLMRGQQLAVSRSRGQFRPTTLVNKAVRWGTGCVKCVLPVAKTTRRTQKRCLISRDKNEKSRLQPQAMMVASVKEEVNVGALLVMCFNMLDAELCFQKYHRKSLKMGMAFIFSLVSYLLVP